MLADIMSDNKHDEKNAQKPKTPQTPFGGWASAPPKSQHDDGQNGAPRAVVSNEDGSQRPAQAEDFAAPRYDATQNAQSTLKEEPKIRSFSDTFGVVKEEGTTLPPVSGDLADDEEIIAASSPSIGAQTPDESSEAEVEDDKEQAAKGQEPEPEPEDPFAWKPEEGPSTHEPRRNLGGGESWMQASTSYEELQSSTRAALKAAEQNPSEEVIVEEVTPTINPYTFNKGEEWTAPPMEADTLAAMDDTTENTPITEEEKPSFEFAAPEPQVEEPQEDETLSLSPFNFTPYAENNEAAESSTTPDAATDMQTETVQAEASADVTDTTTVTEPLAQAPSEDTATETPFAAVDDIPAQEAALTEGTEPVASPYPQPEDPQPAEVSPATRTNFQAYKPAESPPTAAPEEFALQPEEAKLLDKTDPTPAIIAEDTFPAPESHTPEAAADTPIISNDTATTDDAVSSTPSALANGDQHPESLPEDVLSTENPATSQEVPLPEAYTPPPPEESSLPEQAAGAWNTDDSVSIPDAPQQDSTVEPPVPTAETAQPDMDTTTAFGSGTGEYPEGMLTVAQADIPAATEETVHETPQPESAPQAPPMPDMATSSETVNHSHSHEEIQTILQGHALWLESGGKNGRRANFRNADLQQCDLSNSHLAEASFRGANLIGVDFSGSDMRGADMSEAQLSGANFTAASLAGAIFSRTDLRNAIFSHADLQAADFSGASLAGTVLAGLNMSGSVLLDADLQSANLSQASLIGTNLRGANLSCANLTAANLSNANCRDVRFDQAILDGAVFEGANLKNASVQGASLLGTDLSSAGETSPEQRQETIQAEKEQLLQEWQRLKEHEAQVQHLQASIQQREMALQTDRVNAERARRETLAQYENLEKLIARTHEVMRRHRIHDRQFKYFGVLWFIFTILIAVTVMMFINALELNTLDWLELSIVFGGCALIMGLFIATTVRSIKLSNNLKQLLDMYEQQLPPSDKTGH